MVKVAINENEISFVRPIVEADNTLTIQSRSYFLALDDAISLSTVINGTGSPEGLVEGLATKQYMDLTGVAGSILYIKQFDSVAGDKTMGWILV